MAQLSVKRKNAVAIKLSLWSFDSLLLGFSAAVVGWTLAVVGFLDFMSWLCHESDSRLDGVSELVFSANSSSDRQRNRNNGANIVKAEKRAKLSSFRPNWALAAYRNYPRSLSKSQAD